MTRTRIIASAFAVMALAVPASSPAAPAPGGTLVQCFVLEYVNPTHTQASTCTGTSQVMTPGLSLSLIETHANFHAKTATGTITMEWFDAERSAENPSGKLIAKLTCQAVGLYVTGAGVHNSLPGNVQAGAADASHQPFCTQDVPQTEAYQIGLQTLKVTALGETCVGNDPGARNGECWAHGYIHLSPAV